MQLIAECAGFLGLYLSFNDPLPAPSKHLTRCLLNQQLANALDGYRGHSGAEKHLTGAAAHLTVDTAVNATARVFLRHVSITVLKAFFDSCIFMDLVVQLPLSCA